MTNYARGANFERRIMTDLGDNGYFVMRAAGSHGIIDCIAIKARQILLVQCKITGVISPADRTALYALGTKTSGIPLVAYRPSPKKFAYRQLIDPETRGGEYKPFHIDYESGEHEHVMQWARRECVICGEPSGTLT